MMGSTALAGSAVMECDGGGIQSLNYNYDNIY